MAQILIMDRRFRRREIIGKGRGEVGIAGAGETGGSYRVRSDGRNEVIPPSLVKKI